MSVQCMRNSLLHEAFANSGVTRVGFDPLALPALSLPSAFNSINNIRPICCLAEVCLLVSSGK